MTTTTTYMLPPQRPEALAEAHPCAVPACRVPVSPGHVACREHWRAVPQERRDPLIAVFRQRQANPQGFEMAQVIARYLVLCYAEEA